MFNTTRWQLPEQHFRLTLEDDVVMVQYSRTEVFSWPLHISSLESISSSKFWKSVTAHLIWLLDRKPTVYKFDHKQYINITHSQDRLRMFSLVAKDWQIGWRLGQSVLHVLDFITYFYFIYFHFYLCRSLGMDLL